MSIKWIEALYRGACGACGKRFQAGDQIGYVDSALVGLDCCSGIGHPDVKELIPRGKTAKDACGICFIIHSSAQVDCWI